MSDSTFVDTNVLVYAVDDSEPEKRDLARHSLGSGRYGKLVVSAQILGEFYVTVTRKLAQPIAEDKAAEALDWLALLTVVPIDPTLTKHAVQISRSVQLSYWDGLVVAAAIREWLPAAAQRGSERRPADRLDPRGEPLSREALRHCLFTAYCAAARSRVRPTSSRTRWNMAQAPIAAVAASGPKAGIVKR